MSIQPGSPPNEESKETDAGLCDLHLHNDEVHSFDYVIEAPVEICGQEYLQAVQCTHLVHNTGKCAVKRGTTEDLRPLFDKLVQKGLSASIE